MDNLFFLRNAVKVHERLLQENSERLIKKKKNQYTQTYDNSTSICFENPIIRENISTAYLRGDIANQPVIKFDGELESKSRNRELIHNSRIIDNKESVNTDGMIQNTEFATLGETYQDEMNNHELEIANNKTAESTPEKSEKSEVIKYFINQSKFILGKIQDSTVKNRVERLLDYLYSNKESVQKLSLSHKNNLIENNFDTGVNFNEYLNYIATPNIDQGKKPNFYDQIFGIYIDKPQNIERSLPAEKKPGKRIDKKTLNTVQLRPISNAKDSREKNNKWLKSICKKIEVVEDIFTLVSCIGFCIGGNTTTLKKFNYQNKNFVNLIKNTLEDEYGQ